MSAFIRFPLEPSSEVVSFKLNNLMRNPSFRDGMPVDLNEKIVLVCGGEEGEKKLRHQLMDEFQDLAGSGYDVKELANRIKIERVEKMGDVPSSTASAIAIVKTLIFHNRNSTVFFDASISKFVSLGFLKSFHMEVDLRNSFAEEIATLADKYNVKLCRTDSDRSVKRWFKDSNYEISNSQVCFHCVSSFLKQYSKQHLQQMRTN